MSGGLGIPLIDFSDLRQSIAGLAQVGQRQETQRLLNEQLNAALAAQGQPASGVAAPASSPLVALGAPSRNVPSFAQAGGDMGGYLDTIRAKESGGNDLAKNPNSTATGRYQFTEKTWAGLARQHPELGLTPGGRTDPAQQERAIRVFTQQNAQALSNAGLPINPQNLYGAHFLGASGATKFIPSAINNPDAPAASFVGPGVAAANRTVFYNRDGSPKSAGQVYAWLGGSRGGGQQQVAQAPAPVLPQMGQGAPSMIGMGAPQMPGRAPQQVAQADAPAPGAIPIGFNVPAGQGGSDFVPGTEASPALASSRADASAAFGGLSAAGAQRLSPAQVTNLRAMVANPQLQGYAAKIIEGLNKPDEFTFQVVGDQLVRTSKSGRAEVVPNITKPVQFQTFKGSDGNDYIFNPQTGQTTRAIQGKDQSVRDLTPEEKAARNIEPSAFAQVDSEGKVTFPGRAATQVNIDNKGETEFAKKAQGGLADRFLKIAEEGDAARSEGALLGQLNGLGSVVGTGALAATQAWLADKGIKLGDNVGAVEAYGALVDKLVPAQRVPGSGTTSDFDAKGFKASLPRLMNTPEGNALIIGTLQALNEWKVSRAAIAEKALTGELKAGDVVRQLSALPNPNTAFRSGLDQLRKDGKLTADMPGGAGGGGRAVPDALRKQARDAIARGAPRDQVIERLRSKGFDGEGF